MANKMMTAQEAIADIKDGAVIMVGGFMACGTPEILIDALVEKNVKDLTIICNDAGVPGRGVGKLLTNGQIKTLIASHVGLNPEVAARMNTDVEEDKLECILIPQGTLAERIRAGGAGLGGFLTPTGVGTPVETELDELGREKKVVEIEGKKYLLELPLRADYAFCRASICDEFGNFRCDKATKNFNYVMAGAADNVIIASEKVVEIGEMDPDTFAVAGVVVDAIVEGEPKWQI